MARFGIASKEQTRVLEGLGQNIESGSGWTLKGRFRQLPASIAMKAAQLLMPAAIIQSSHWSGKSLVREADDTDKSIIPKSRYHEVCFAQVNASAFYETKSSELCPRPYSFRGTLYSKGCIRAFSVHS